MFGWVSEVQERALKTVGKVQVDSNSQINRNVASHVKSIMRPTGSTELNGHHDIF